MGVLQGVADVGAQLGRFPKGEQATGEHLGQSKAYDKIGDQVELAVVDADLMDGDDRGEAELGNGAGFAHEAIDILRCGADVAGAGDLDGDDAVELGVAGLEHGDKRAFAEELIDLELAESLDLGAVTLEEAHFVAEGKNGIGDKNGIGKTGSGTFKVLCDG